MKKIFTVFVLLLCLKNTNAQYVTIPDANFATYLQSNFPSCMVGNQMDITCTGIQTVTIVDVTNLSNTTYNSILIPTRLNNQTENIAAIYPNPTNSIFTIELNSKERQLIQLFDITGNVVLSQTIENGKGIIDASHLAAGVYNISIKGNNSVINKKVVIVK